MAHHIIYYQYGKVVVNVTEEDSAVGICPKYQYSLILGHHALVSRIMKHGKCISTSTNRFLQRLVFFEKDSFEAAILASHIRNFCICFLPFLLKCCLDGSDFGLPLLYSYHTISPVLLLQSQLFLCLCQGIFRLFQFQSSFLLCTRKCLLYPSRGEERGGMSKKRRRRMNDNEMKTQVKSTEDATGRLFRGQLTGQTDMAFALFLPPYEPQDLLPIRHSRL